MSSFIQSYNFNLTAFLKLKNFYDLGLFKRIPENHKNKNVEEKLLVPSRQMLPPKCSLPRPESKYSHSLQAAVFEEFVTFARQKEWRGRGTVGFLKKKKTSTMKWVKSHLIFSYLFCYLYKYLKMVYTTENLLTK